MRLRVVTVIIRPLSVTVQKQPFYNLFEKIAFPILCLTVIGHFVIYVSANSMQVACYSIPIARKQINDLQATN